MHSATLTLLFFAASVAAAPAVMFRGSSSSESTTTISEYPVPTSAMSPSGSFPTPSSDPSSIITQMQQAYFTNTQRQLRKSTAETSCTENALSTRRSWDALSDSDRTAYLTAVKCLASKPSQSDPSLVPGARNRRDDFVYAHINQTDLIHNSGLLLPWHRQYVWAYEQALQHECGYTGAQPYWDWSAYAADQTQSKVFDGSATSFGGNGASVPHNATSAPMIGLPVAFQIQRPAGTGGGCVQGGGLGNYTVHLGPVAPAHNAPDNQYGTHYNPRCLSRDFIAGMSAANLSTDAVAELLQTPDIHAFHPLLEIKMHPNSHSFAGGDLYDLFSSPNDPVFFLLHAQIDRLWAMWQGQDLAGRTAGLDGTQTFLNLPASANATLQTVMKMGTAGGDVPIADVMSPTGGQFCYVYA